MKKHLPVILFLLIYFFATAYKLVRYPRPFYDWDEAINAQVAREMIEKRSFFPLWQGKVWLDKPPLAFLLLGTVTRLTSFTSAEISLRIFSLILSLIALFMIYLLFLKVERLEGKIGVFLPLLTVIITAFTPIFLQRSQIVNLDVFLLIGWLGYLLFFKSYWLSLFFLSLAVLTKSLVGFYPVVILFFYYLLLFLIRRIKKEELKKVFLKLSSHCGILGLWYLIMFVIFGQSFWQQHIIETHFRRVTASIESHFGERTYYLNLLFEQLGVFGWLSVLGLGYIIWKLFTKNLKIDDLIIYLYFLPWFIFLNFTKTKIFWYFYPAIPQFAFLSVYPLTIFISHNEKEYKGKVIKAIKKTLAVNRDRIFKKFFFSVLILAVVGLIYYQNFIKINFFATFYSQPENYYFLAKYAKNRCHSLTVLVSKDARQATNTLEKMGLTISSTKQWGDHPSIVYYFGKKVDFEYDLDKLKQNLSRFTRDQCLAIWQNDLSEDINKSGLKILAQFNSLFLLVKSF